MTKVVEPNLERLMDALAVYKEMNQMLAGVCDKLTVLLGSVADRCHDCWLLNQWQKRQLGRLRNWRGFYKSKPVAQVYCPRCLKIYGELSRIRQQYDRLNDTAYLTALRHMDPPEHAS